MFCQAIFTPTVNPFTMSYINHVVTLIQVMGLLYNHLYVIMYVFRGVKQQQTGSEAAANGERSSS